MNIAFKRQSGNFVTTFLNNQTKTETNMICDRKPTITKSFPCLLHEMLSNADIHGYENIISWQPHGRAFRIHKPKEFSEDIMPTIFLQSKWSSFQRQLNRYDFNRITCGPDKGGYYHESFLRGKPELVSYVVCTPVKGTMKRRPTNPDNVPNFYSLLDFKEKERRKIPYPSGSIKTQDSESVSHVLAASLPTCITPDFTASEDSVVYTRSDDLDEMSEVTDDDLYDLLRSLFGSSTPNTINKNSHVTKEETLDVSLCFVNNETNSNDTATNDFSSSLTNCYDREWESFMDTAFD